MRQVKSSKRYAQAIFQIAIDNKNIDIWRHNLSRIAELMSNPDLVILLSNPNVPFDTKAKITHDLLDEIDALALNYAYLLISKNKTSLATQIRDEFENLINEYHGIKSTEVSTAIPIEDSNKDTVKKQLETIIGSKISIVYKVDPTILGGIVARFNGSLLDGSIRNNLEMLKRNLVGISSKFP